MSILVSREARATARVARTIRGACPDELCIVRATLAVALAALVALATLAALAALLHKCISAPLAFSPTTHKKTPVEMQSTSVL